MPVKLAETRPNVTDLEEAKAVFARLARGTIEAAKIRAQAEARIARIKAEAAEREAPIASAIAADEATLRAFILAHPEHFKKPRQVATDWGKFGLRTLPPDVLISDEPRLVQVLLENGYEDCFETVHKPVKAGLKTRLEAGEKLPGATLREGYEEAIYTVAKALIEEAKESAG